MPWTTRTHSSATPASLRVGAGAGSGRGGWARTSSHPVALPVSVGGCRQHYRRRDGIEGARRRGRTACLAGDGAWAYSLGEIETCAPDGTLPVISVVLNNSTLGWIKHARQGRYPGHQPLRGLPRGGLLRSQPTALEPRSSGCVTSGDFEAAFCRRPSRTTPADLGSSRPSPTASRRPVQRNKEKAAPGQGGY